MSETATMSNSNAAEDVPKLERLDPFLQEVEQRWTALAAFAWENYQRCGRGTVMIDRDDQVSFFPGSPCPCHRQMAESYDPERQFIVAKHDGDTVFGIRLVAGWIDPPEAARITPAERFRLTEH